MTRRSLNLTDPLREPPVFARLRRKTARMPMAIMQSAPEQGRLLALSLRSEIVMAGRDPATHGGRCGAGRRGWPDQSPAMTIVC